MRAGILVRNTAAIVSILMTIAAGAAQAAPKKKPVGEPRENYEVQTKKQLDQLDKRVDELKERTADFGPQGKARFSHRLQMLERKVASAHARWEDLVRATSTKWTKARRSLDETLAEIRKAYRELAQTKNP